MKVSIITATHNSQSTIADAIYSVASQDYQDIEHIIIDGNSSDNTLTIINEMDNRVSKIISEADNGIYDALNKGIANASGEVIAFLHADDIYASSNSIKLIIQKMKASGSDSAYADLQYISKNNLNKVIRNWKSGKFSHAQLKKGWMPPHPTFFVKKKHLQKIWRFRYII